MSNKIRTRLEEQKLKLNDWDGFREELDAGGDRSFVILCGSRIDAYIDELLRKVLVDDPSEVLELLRGPLGTAGAKARTLYCLGALSPSEYRNLNILRKIRNKFAHELHGLSLESPEIVDLCSRLEIPLEAHEGAIYDSKGRLMLALITLDISLPLRLQLISHASVRPERTWEEEMEEISRKGRWAEDS
jgi:mannitol operon repressor